MGPLGETVSNVVGLATILYFVLAVERGIHNFTVQVDALLIQPHRLLLHIQYFLSYQLEGRDALLVQVIRVQGFQKNVYFGFSPLVLVQKWQSTNGFEEDETMELG